MHKDFDGGSQLIIPIMPHFSDYSAKKFIFVEIYTFYLYKTLN